MAKSEARQNRLEITLLERDLKEEQGKTSALQMENTRLENEIRDLRRKLSLAAAATQVEVEEPQEPLSAGIRASPDIPVLYSDPNAGIGSVTGEPEAELQNRSSPAIIDVDVSNPSTPPQTGKPRKAAMTSPTSRPLESSEGPASISNNEGVGSELEKESLSRTRRGKRKAEPQSPLLETRSKRAKATIEHHADTKATETVLASYKLIKGKIRKDKAFMLPETKGVEYLQDASPLTIHPPPSSITFSRQFLSDIHGGSVQQFLAISRNKSRLFIFPTSDVNPWMPTSPGAPGLLLSSRKGMLNRRCTLLSRVQKSPAEWMYFGEYDCTVVGKMTAEEFKQQRQTVKTQWGKKLLKAKKWPEYVDMRARMLSRKSSQSNVLSIEDVITSLEAGEEQIDVVRMNCVLYDHEFAQSLSSALKAWTPKEKKKASKPRSRGKKAAKYVSSDEDESEDEDEETESDS
ncbi:hypothetical protein DXG01_011025 [Tephrocybe rancida]|nr:hypothetical protein DXG01_011025 [Tephrocybe rancida]